MIDELDLGSPPGWGRWGSPGGERSGAEACDAEVKARTMLRILLADDHHIVRRGLRGVIERHPGWEVFAEASDGEQALELGRRNGPDVAVVEAWLPVIDGVTLTRRLRKQNPRVGVLLFSMCDHVDVVRAGLAAGARGYLLKSDSESHLEAAIAAVHLGLRYLSQSFARSILDEAPVNPAPAPEDLLTKRELEVARLIAAGHGNKAIALLLGISCKTVEAHRASAMRKSGARNGAELVRFGLRHNLIEA